VVHLKCDIERHGCFLRSGPALSREQPPDRKARQRTDDAEARLAEPNRREGGKALANQAVNRDKPPVRIEVTGQIS
jgi:hypothetical protein